VCKAQHCIYVLVRKDVQHICAQKDIHCAIWNVLGCLSQVSTDLPYMSSIACSRLHIFHCFTRSIHVCVHSVHVPPPRPPRVSYMSPWGQLDLPLGSATCHPLGSATCSPLGSATPPPPPIPPPRLGQLHAVLSSFLHEISFWPVKHSTMHVGVVGRLDKLWQAMCWLISVSITNSMHVNPRVEKLHAP